MKSWVIHGKTPSHPVRTDAKVVSLGAPFSLLFPGRPLPPPATPHGIQCCKLDPGGRRRRRSVGLWAEADGLRQAGIPLALDTPLALLWRRNPLSRNGIRQDALLFEEEEEEREILGGPPSFPFVQCFVMWWFPNPILELSL